MLSAISVARISRICSSLLLKAPEDGKKHRHKPNRMSDAEKII
jgi:hypothetical protein